MRLYDKTAIKISKVVTECYSTSFSMATSLLEKQHRDAIYSIYGFVRFADEIVDTFHDFPKRQLLEKFEADLKEALQQDISLNPILHSFQQTVKKYNIPIHNIEAFLSSMKSDLEKKTYDNKTEANDYIYGSADVVGLMCLRIFVDGNETRFKALEKPAMKLGSAFQKVNFIRDLKEDTQHLGRSYFPELNNHNFNEKNKAEIIADIESDFGAAFLGIKQLPQSAKIAVLAAYYYYRGLLEKIKNTPAEKVIGSRIRISDTKKLMLLFKAKTVCKFGLV